MHAGLYLDSTDTTGWLGQPAVNPIVVYSDHNPLIFVNRMRNKNQRLTRWSLMLQPYNLSVRHIAGRDNVISDMLSRP